METIVAAAIRHSGAIWSVPRPGRHHDVIAYIIRERPWITHVDGEQGFIAATAGEQGRFVSRTEARRIADKAGQIIASCTGPDGVPFKRNHDELFSEDVW